MSKSKKSRPSGRKKAEFEVSAAQAHRSQAGWVEGHDADVFMEQLINVCENKPCDDQKKLSRNEMLYSVEFLADNLPAVQFVGQFYLELIIHGGIIAENEYSQKKLDAWLQRKNPYGQTNGNVIREALLSSIIYGYSGLRDVLGNLIYIAPNRFRIWKLPALAEGRPIPGVTVPLLYEVTTDKKVDIEDEANKNHVFDTGNEGFSLANVIAQEGYVLGVDGSYFQDDGFDGARAPQVFVPLTHFCHLRHSDEGTYGKSPLATDRLRTTLIVDYIKNVIDEVNNDGNDYLMWMKATGMAGASLTSIMSNQSANESMATSYDQKMVKTAAERRSDASKLLAKKLKRTAKTRVGVVSENYVDRIEKLPGTVNLYEYLSVLNDAKAVVADIYGIPAMLAGSSGGGWSTGMSSLIPFTLERTIKPFQQRYAEQLSDIIRRCAGLAGPVHFKELNWEDEKTRAEIAKIGSEVERNLAQANKANAEALVASQPQPQPESEPESDNENENDTKE